MPIKTPGNKLLSLIKDDDSLKLFEKDLSLKDAISFAFSKSKEDAELEMKSLKNSDLNQEEMDKIVDEVTSKLSERIAYAIDEYIKETIVTIKSDIEVHVDTEIDGRRLSGTGKTVTLGTS